ncbi:response regulator transcription factor [Chloroflexota bacterium]
MPDSILIIDDKLNRRREVASALTDSMFEVAGVSSYFEALDILNHFKPDLIILDAKLPLVDGWEASYRLHRYYGFHIIVIGRDSIVDGWARALDTGADYYITVPFSTWVLVAIIRAILRRYNKTNLAYLA